MKGEGEGEEWEEEAEEEGEWEDEGNEERDIPDLEPCPLYARVRATIQPGRRDGSASIPTGITQTGGCSCFLRA